MPNPKSSEQIVAELLEEGVEFSTIDLEQMPQEDLIQIVQILRGHILQLSGLIGELSEQIKIVDAFARPKSRRFYYVPGKEHIIQ